jgi:hypothetical protein
MVSQWNLLSWKRIDISCRRMQERERSRESSLISNLQLKLTSFEISIISSKRFIPKFINLASQELSIKSSNAKIIQHLPTSVFIGQKFPHLTHAHPIHNGPFISPYYPPHPQRIPFKTVLVQF